MSSIMTYYTKEINILAGFSLGGTQSDIHMYTYINR